MTELDKWCAASGDLEIPSASVKVDVAGALGVILEENRPAVGLRRSGATKAIDMHHPDEAAPSVMVNGYLVNAGYEWMIDPYDLTR